VCQVLEAKIMGRRKELKNIAAGLYGSFISRNNDVAGYWGVGKLCLLANRQHVPQVFLNLIEQRMSPQCSEFDKLLVGYKRKMMQHLQSRNIPESCVASAKIELNFMPEPPEKYVPITTWGSLFLLAVTIKDDRGQIREISGYGYCAQHSSRRESKSAGEERF